MSIEVSEQLVIQEVPQLGAVVGQLVVVTGNVGELKAVPMLVLV
jgi:hypothetical protein